MFNIFAGNFDPFERPQYSDHGHSWLFWLMCGVYGFCITFLVMVLLVFIQ